MTPSRSTWTRLGDAELLKQCGIDTYRASGPGGQKRNKTSSAVRLRHLPTGILVIAEESRSQHENRVRALKRLRRAFFLQLRETLPAEWLNPDGLAKRCEGQGGALPGDGRLNLGLKDARFWPTIGLILDVLQAADARVSEAAAALGVSTGNLIRFLRRDPNVWQQVNTLRTRCGHKALKD